MWLRAPALTLPTPRPALLLLPRPRGPLPLRPSHPLLKVARAAISTAAIADLIFNVCTNAVTANASVYSDFTATGIITDADRR